MQPVQIIPVIKIIMNNNIFSTLLKIYSFIVGLCWIIFQIYFRFVAKKNSYNFYELKLIVTTKILTIFLLFVLLHFFIIISITLHFYRMKKNKEPSPIMIKISDRLSFILYLIYWKPLLYIYDLLGPNLPGTGRFFIWLNKRWNKKNYSPKYFYTLIFLFDILPKLIMAITFFVEILFYNRLYYFLYTIFLILIPIILRIFLKLFIDFSY